MIVKKEDCYVKNNQIAILISPKYGAAWSSINDFSLAYDKRIVQKWIELQENEIENDEEEMQEFLAELGYPKHYMGGYENLRIEWVNIGEYFYIDDYDGYEGIIYEDEMLKVE